MYAKTIINTLTVSNINKVLLINWFGFWVIAQKPFNTSNNVSRKVPLRQIFQTSKCRNNVEIRRSIVQSKCL